mmetsp:Transcript_12729/g.43075  ORF Transcript_12729/g.43075 Transcript_12729/m.43075 type:complete len:239 (-) Transcript_12729:558-1274(-)
MPAWATSSKSAMSVAERSARQPQSAGRPSCASRARQPRRKRTHAQNPGESIAAPQKVSWATSWETTWHRTKAPDTSPGMSARSPVAWSTMSASSSHSAGRPSAPGLRPARASTLHAAQRRWARRAARAAGKARPLRSPQASTCRPSPWSASARAMSPQRAGAILRRSEFGAASMKPSTNAGASCEAHQRSSPETPSRASPSGAARAAIAARARSAALAVAACQAWLAADSAASAGRSR